MIITDYNKMTISEIEKINKNMGISFVIENGEISGVEIDEKL